VREGIEPVPRVGHPALRPEHAVYALDPPFASPDIRLGGARGHVDDAELLPDPGVAVGVGYSVSCL
jgi:hypothetical protein